MIQNNNFTHEQYNEYLHKVADKILDIDFEGFYEWMHVGLVENGNTIPEESEQAVKDIVRVAFREGITRGLHEANLQLQRDAMLKSNIPQA